MAKKYINTGNKDTRSGFGAGLLEAGRKNPNIVALAADLAGSVKMDAFAKEFPERFFQCGIAEANMIGAAAGLAITGKVPFAGSFAEFVTGRVYDQIRQEVAYGHTNVKIASSHSGITLGEDGATHQTMEDIALMRALPNMVVINPCDYNQCKAATLAIAEYNGPVYLRYGRPSMPNFTPEDQVFEIGKAVIMNESDEIDFILTQTGRPNDGTDPTGFFNIEFNIQLKPEEDWLRDVKKDDVIQEIRSKLRNFQGAVIDCCYEMDEGSVLYLEEKLRQLLFCSCIKILLKYR